MLSTKYNISTTMSSKTTTEETLIGKNILHADIIYLRYAKKYMSRIIITRNQSRLNALHIQLQTKMFLKRLRACRTIQKQWRNGRQLDPISLQRIITPYHFVRGNHHVTYDAATLKEYILHTGDLRDPISRVDFLEEDIRRLDHIYPYKPLVFPLLYYLLEIRSTNIVNFGLCDAFERELMNCFYELSTLEDDNAMNTMQSQNGALILQTYGNLKSIDPQRCKLTLKHMLHTFHLNINILTHPRYYIFVKHMLVSLYSQLKDTRG